MVHPPPTLGRPLRATDPSLSAVWTALAVERQEQVIRLLAHRTCALAAAQVIPPKEHVHVYPTRRR